MEKLKIVIAWQDVDAFNARYFAAHPRAKNKPIKKPQHPSLNETMIGNNMKINQMKQNWKDFMLFILERDGLLGANIDRCVIEYVTYFGDNRVHDADNITPKFILDGLVAGGFLVADDINHIRELRIIGDRDKENPRIEILVSVI